MCIRDSLRAAWRYGRSPHRYLPGAGEPTTGYIVLCDPAAEPAPTADAAARGELLWDI